MAVGGGDVRLVACGHADGRRRRRSPTPADGARAHRRRARATAGHGSEDTDDDDGGEELHRVPPKTMPRPCSALLIWSPMAAPARAGSNLRQVGAIPLRASAVSRRAAA